MGAAASALLAEAQRTYQVLRLEGPDNVTAHAQFLMQAIDDSLADRSVGVAEIEHEHAKAKELAGLGWTKVSRPTVQRMRLAYQRQGLLGLVDKRSLRASSPTGRTDERVVAAVLEALCICRGRRGPA